MLIKLNVSRELKGQQGATSNHIVHATTHKKVTCHNTVTVTCHNTVTFTCHNTVTVTWHNTQESLEEKRRRKKYLFSPTDSLYDDGDPKYK